MTVEKAEKIEIDSEGFRKLARLHDVPSGTILQVLLDYEEWEVAIANIRGKIYAFRDVCPHSAFPLSVGHLAEGCQIICAAHHWKFSLETGKAVTPPIRKGLELYPVRVEYGDIWVKVRTW
jgi:nitrite reductase/ring-hydroxylating ferredoxin subunit